MIGSLARGSVSFLARQIPNALLVGSSLHSFRERAREGQNPILAGMREAGTLALSVMLPMGPQLAIGLGVPVARAVTQGVIGSINQHNNFIRTARTSFSHRFEASQVAMQMQQAGLQSIGASWAYAGQGSEASRFHTRYGRR